MWDSKISRRRFLALTGTALAGTLLGQAVGRSSAAPAVTTNGMLHIGLVLPTTGDRTLGAFGNSAILGSAANRGAILAGDEILGQVGPSGRQFKALISSAPDTDSMLRAARRMTREEGAYAIIGGFTTDDAQALSSLAVEDDFIFLNIGAQSDSLRGSDCSRNTFHLSDSVTACLDAMITLGTQSPAKRWYFVYSDEPGQQAKMTTAAELLHDHRDVSIAGSVKVAQNVPFYSAAFTEIARVDPELVILLLTPNEQLTFLAQYGASGLTARTMCFPSPVAQSRQFYAAYLANLPEISSAQHIATWDATLENETAVNLNSRYLERFGLAMDPLAWAAYAGVKVMAEAAVKADSTESTDLIDYLEDEGVQFDVGKAAETSFRPWDHQMRQPLYLVRTQRDFKDRTTLRDLAKVERQFPQSDGASPVSAQQLDMLGVNAADSVCNMHAPQASGEL